MRTERGIALVFVLFLLTTISALAVSLTFLANSETLASGNYRLATQARYGAESAAQKAADFLLDSVQYNPATVAPGGLVNNSASPVKFNGANVLLSSNVQDSVYPDVATKNAFAALYTAPNNLIAGNTAIALSATAQLIYEDAFSDAYLGGTTIVQTWKITANGTINGIRASTVQIETTIETPEVPAFKYAAFAANNQC